MSCTVGISFLAGIEDLGAKKRITKKLPNHVVH
jgi:hypothetical protein